MYAVCKYNKAVSERQKYCGFFSSGIENYKEAEKLLESIRKLERTSKFFTLEVREELLKKCQNKANEYYEINSEHPLLKALEQTAGSSADESSRKTVAPSQHPSTN